MSKKVFKYRPTGELICTYESISEAASEVSVDESTLRKKLNVKDIATQGEHLFSYLQKENIFHGMESEEEVVSPARVLLIDIETSPIIAYVWRMWDQNLNQEQVIQDWFMISWAAKWLFEPEVMSDVLTPLEAIEPNDGRIVASIWKLLNEADIVIAHNGKGFDIPKLNTRFLLHKLPPPTPYQVIDTNQVVKNGNFGFSSNSLNFIGQALGLSQKIDTNFSLWRRCMNGEKEALEYMSKYNRQDVLVLEEIYMTLRSWIRAHPNLNLYNEVNEDIRKCPTCSADELVEAGTYATPFNTYSTYRCTHCGALSRSVIRTTAKKSRNLQTVSIAK